MNIENKAAIEKILDEIQENIEKIKEVEDFLILEKGNEQFEITRDLADFKEELERFRKSSKINTYEELFTEEDYKNRLKILENLKERIEEIKTSTQNENFTKVNFGNLMCSFSKYNSYFSQIKLTEERTKKEYLIKLYNTIKSRKPLFDSIGVIYNYLNEDDYEEDLTLKFFDIFKKTILGPSDVRDRLERELTDLLYLHKTKKLNEEVDKITKLSKEVREKLGLIEDQKIIFAHQNFSKQQDCSIFRLSCVINIIFLLIIASLIYLFNYFLEQKNEFNWRNYILYLSIYITLTGYLTYLIKERVRLLNIKTYCDKTWLEITALSSYMVEFKQDEVVKLKMQLADKYFAGPNNESSNIKELSPELTASLIMELIKSEKNNSSK
ncbi:hypothetical protein ABTD46_16130 [Acinetobacter baumannii]